MLIGQRPSQTEVVAFLAQLPVAQQPARDPVRLVTKDQGLRVLLKQSESAGQTAAGACGRLAWLHQCKHLIQLFWTASVVRQCLAQRCALSVAGQQCSRGAINGESSEPGAQLIRNGCDQLDAAFLPILWIGQISLVAGGRCVQQITLSIEDSHPYTTGAQIDAERQ